MLLQALFIVVSPCLRSSNIFHHQFMACQFFFKQQLYIEKQFVVKKKMEKTIERKQYLCFCSKSYNSYAGLYLHLKTKHMSAFEKYKNMKISRLLILQETTEQKEIYRLAKPQQKGKDHQKQKKSKQFQNIPKSNAAQKGEKHLPIKDDFQRIYPNDNLMIKKIPKGSENIFPFMQSMHQQYQFTKQPNPYMMPQAMPSMNPYPMMPPIPSYQNFMPYQYMESPYYSSMYAMNQQGSYFPQFNQPLSRNSNESYFTTPQGVPVVMLPIEDGEKPDQFFISSLPGEQQIKKIKRQSEKSLPLTDPVELIEDSQQA